jgi:HPt (histidine-containing phosphotransfer) domain-containing protein
LYVLCPDSNGQGKSFFSMIIDRDKALERLDGNRDLYYKMVGYFIRDYSDYPERIKTLVSTRDNEAYILTHSLKNMAASLGANALSRRALKLEFYLKKGILKMPVPWWKWFCRISYPC